MSNTTSAQAVIFETGDVVWGRPVVEGKTLGRRKGIVLGYLADDADRIIVWWYGMGAATSDNTTLMFRRELTKSGDIFDFGGRQAGRLALMADAGYGRARPLRNTLHRHAVRMTSLGVK